MFDSLFGNAKPQTTAISIGTAVLGILSGYSLFILWWEHAEKHTAATKFAAALLVAALISLIFELLRGLIEEHKLNLSAQRIIETVLMLAVFELFVIAGHNVAELKRGTFVGVAVFIFGEQFAEQPAYKVSPGWNVAALAGLWIGVAVTIAWRLRSFIWSLPPEDAGQPGKVSPWAYLRSMWPQIKKGARVGLLAGAVWGPICAVWYVLAFRAYFAARWVQENPSQWLHEVGLFARGFGYLLAVPLRIMGFLPVWLGATGFFFLLAIWTVVARALASKRAKGWATSVPIIVVGLFSVLPILLVQGPSLLHPMLRQLLQLVYLAIIIWGVPSILLGMLAPLLRRPADSPQIWGLLAFIATALLGVATYVRQHAGDTTVAENGLLLGEIVLFLYAGIMFLRGTWGPECWSLLALIIGTITWGGVALVHQAEVNLFHLPTPQHINLLEMQRNAHDLIAIPLTPPPAQEPDIISVFPSTSIADFGFEKIRNEDWCLPLAQVVGDRDKLRDCIEQLTEDAQWELQSADKMQQQLYSLPANVEQLARNVDRKALETYEKELEYDHTLVERTEIAERLVTLLKDAQHLLGLPSERSSDDLRDPVLNQRLALLRQVQAKRDAALERLANSVQGSLKDLEKNLEKVKQLKKRAIERLEDVQFRLASRLEMAMASSIGFWITVGMLAIWALIRH